MNASGEPTVFDVVAYLLETQKGASALEIVQLNTNYATLVDARGRAVHIFHHPGKPELVEELIERVVDQNQPPGSDLLLLGGTDSAGIQEAIPRLQQHPFVVIQLRSKGDVEIFPRGKRSRLEATWHDIPRLSEDDAIALLATAGRHADLRMQEGKARADFFAQLKKGKPRATYAILGAIGVMFLLQQLWAPALKSVQAQQLFLIAMGALDGRLVEAGQWWRMVSAGFLHGGLLHVGANSFVLYLLGGQLERVLGVKRFLVLYTVALFGGSFLSIELREAGLSVGASGAIWGLLAAQACLAYGRPPVLPRSIAEAMRPLARQNLLLNVGISFMANIDWAAHLGGGLAGVALLISGVLYQGSGSLKPGGDPDENEPSWLGFAAGICVALLLFGVASALLWGKPWSLDPSLLAS